MKYRIKAKQRFAIFSLFNIDEQPNEYVVQAKNNWLPIWFTVTRTFQELTQAQEYIKLVLEEFTKEPQ